MGRTLYWSFLKLTVTATGKNSRYGSEKITAASTISIQTNVHTGSLERQIHLSNMLFTKIFTLLSWCIYESDIFLLILLFKINDNKVWVSTWNTTYTHRYNVERGVEVSSMSHKLCCLLTTFIFILIPSSSIEHLPLPCPDLRRWSVGSRHRGNQGSHVVPPSHLVLHRGRLPVHVGCWGGR